MDFMDAVKWMREGKKVTTRLWGVGAYIHLKKGNIVYSSDNPFFGNTVEEELKATDWEIYDKTFEEHKKHCDWCKNEEDNWNLADEVGGEFACTILVKDIKTFIQKVKEDVKEKCDMNESGLNALFDISEILDKRAGRL